MWPLQQSAAGLHLGGAKRNGGIRYLLARWKARETVNRSTTAVKVITVREWVPERRCISERRSKIETLLIRERIVDIADHPVTLHLSTISFSVKQWRTTIWTPFWTVSSLHHADLSALADENVPCNAGCLDDLEKPATPAVLPTPAVAQSPLGASPAPVRCPHVTVFVVPRF